MFARSIRAARPRKAKRLIWVPYDQLHRDHQLLTDLDGDTAVVVLESAWKPARRRYHKQKLVLLLSAQRHFATELAERGIPVVWHFTEGDYAQGLEEARDALNADRIVCSEPAEPEVASQLERLDRVDVHPNTFFSTSFDFYHSVFRGKRSRLLETFYRNARRNLGVLMDDGAPAGGKWNFDASNRRTWKGTPSVPARPWFEPDDITREVIDLVESRYPEHFGEVTPFGWPVTRKEAEVWASHFFDYLLPHFGPFEDAMHADEPFLFHSLLSAPLNLGLLDPLDLCRRAEDEYRAGRATIESVEGFVRQIVGWREFVRHVHREHLDLWPTTNALDATRDLPEWYWNADSGLACLDDTIRTVLERGHSHHITRLMVLSNLATLLGVEPQQLNEWFWIAYVDAYEWVVTPNVIGMGTWADGGVMATKPYVSSGRYIRKMGATLCDRCRYDVNDSTGENACPFNYLYWGFVERHRELLEKNPRMKVITGQIDRMDEDKLAAMQNRARAFARLARS
jgi:deoxyribodipyrimidine photolyase-related protein